MDISKLLLDWYDRYARTLPWRGERDPYRIWLSEIMLQQTGTKTVEGYYARFLERFPKVEVLASADTDEVLKLWEGLGYYSRARNLHKAAKAVAQNGGAFPTSAKELMKLPGVGPYTSRAIASIAFGEAVPALDGNQMRVLSRVHAVEAVLETPFALEDIALEDISKERPGDCNQALMDLGALVCTPLRPKCESCPLSPVCKAHADGAEERYPLRPAPIVKKEIELTILLIETEDSIVVRQRPSKGLLGGLWEFYAVDGYPDDEELISLLADAGFETDEAIEVLPDAKHVFTHLVWHMRGRRIRCSRVPEGTILADRAFFDTHAFPGALRRYREIAYDIVK